MPMRRLTRSVDQVFGRRWRPGQHALPTGRVATRPQVCGTAGADRALTGHGFPHTLGDAADTLSTDFAIDIDRIDLTAFGLADHQHDDFQ